MRACLLLALLSFGCDSSPAPATDGGPPPGRDAAIPAGDFAVSLVHDGEAVADGSEVGVDFGCQGGAHVEVDVFAVADHSMGDATARVEVFGGPQPVDTTLRLEGTPRGGEVIALFATFGDFMSFLGPGDFSFPMDVTLRATVTDLDGSVVDAEHAVTLVMGSECTCTHTDAIPGTGTIVTWAVSGDATGCGEVQVDLELTWEPDDDMHVFYPPPPEHSFAWPAECVDALMLEEGGAIRLDVRDSFPGSPCSPPIYFEPPDREALGCGCPVEE